MLPCCTRTEQHYLTREGDIEPDFLKTFSEEAYAIEREDKDSEWGKLVFARKGWYPSLLIVVEGETEHQLCQCSCHRSGSMMMH